MPVVNGQGFGGNTEAKQADFRYLVGYHLNVVDCMVAKARRAGHRCPPQRTRSTGPLRRRRRHPQRGARLAKTKTRSGTSSCGAGAAVRRLTDRAARGRM